MKRFKKWIAALAIVLSSFMMTSCVTPVEAQVVAGAATVETIITYGVPYMVDGVISYYLYDGLYWYPYWDHGHRYFRPHRAPYRYGHAVSPRYKYPHNRIHRPAPRFGTPPQRTPYYNREYKHHIPNSPSGGFRSTIRRHSGMSPRGDRGHRH